VLNCPATIFNHASPTPRYSERAGQTLDFPLPIQFSYRINWNQLCFIRAQLCWYIVFDCEIRGRRFLELTSPIANFEVKMFSINWALIVQRTFSIELTLFPRFGHLMRLVTEVRFSDPSHCQISISKLSKSLGFKLHSSVQQSPSIKLALFHRFGHLFPRLKFVFPASLPFTANPSYLCKI